MIDTTAFIILAGVTVVAAIFAFALARWDFQRYAERLEKEHLSREQQLRTIQLPTGTLHHSVAGWEYRDKNGMRVPLPGSQVEYNLQRGTPANEIEAWILNEMEFDDEEWS